MNPKVRIPAVIVLVCVSVLVLILCLMVASALLAAGKSSTTGTTSTTSRASVATKSTASKVSAIDKANDNSRRAEVKAIVTAIELYQVDNDKAIPVDADGAALPVVTMSDVMTKGIPADKLGGIAPTYLTVLPLDPERVSYRVGRTADGKVLVAARLSDNTTYGMSTK